MTTKLLALCVAAFGLGSFAVSEASARDAAPAANTFPAIVRVNAVEVNINTGHRRHYHHYSRPYRSVRHVYFRHGRRYVTYSRVYY